MSRARWLGLQGWLAAVMVSVGFAASLAVLVTVLPTLEQTIRRDRAGEIAGHITQVVRSHQPDNLTPVIADWDQIADGIGDDLGGGQVRISADGVVRGQSRSCCALLDSFPPLGPRDGGQSQLTASGNALRVRVPLQVSNTFAQIATVDVAVQVQGGSAELTYVRRRVMIAVAAVFGLAALAAVALARVFGGRIRRLALTAARLAAGDMSARAPLTGPQELATLGDGLNVMATRIERQIDQLTVERDRARVLISSLAEGVFAVRDDSTLTQMNPSALRLLGVSPEPPPATAAELPPPVLRAVVEGARSASDVTEGEAVLRDGTELSVVTARQVGQDGGLVVTLRDVTQERRLERARRDLVANVSHELKTPLSAIKGLLELLESADVKPDDRRAFVGIMTTEADRLERLVEEQLQLARLDAGALPLERERVDLDALAEGVAASRRPLAEAAGIELGVSVPPDPVTVNADGARVEQILLILMDNALRHTGAGGRIDISVEVAGTAALMRVADTGEGISEADLPFVFDRFYRGDRSREGRSAGLGLAIARGLATAHGGSMDVASTLGKGSTFTLRLPIAAAPTQEHPVMPVVVVPE